MSTVSTTEATLCHSSGEVIGNWRDYAGGSRADSPRDRKPWLWSGTDGAGVKESLISGCSRLCPNSVARLLDVAVRVARGIPALEARLVDAQTAEVGAVRKEARGD